MVRNNGNIPPFKNIKRRVCTTVQTHRQASSSHLVPERNDSVGPNSSKGPILLLKGNRIDTIDIVLLSMTLEGKVVLVADLLDVLNPHSSFDAPDGKSCLIGKATDASRIVFEGRFFARMLPGLGSADVVDDYLPIAGSHHHEISANVQIIDTLGHGDFTDRIGTSSIPKLTSGIRD